MEFKTAEQKLLHDYEILEDENMRLCDENARLHEKVADLERRVADLGEQAHRLAVERDQRTDCIKDMMAVAKFYGIDQPQHVPGEYPIPEDMREEYGLKAVDRA